MLTLVPLMSLLRFVPPHRVVTGKPSPRPPSALCLMGSASTGFRYVTLCRPPTSPEQPSIGQGLSKSYQTGSGPPVF